jgi:hypothetical protein
MRPVSLPDLVRAQTVPKAGDTLSHLCFVPSELSPVAREAGGAYDGTVMPDLAGDATFGSAVCVLTSAGVKQAGQTVMAGCL